jgi:hypothetical protein
MSESIDTSAIDEKKAQTFLSDKKVISNIKPILSSSIALFIAIIFYYTGSGLILYICKLSQSNILPTDINCAPYTDSTPIITPVQIDIFQTVGNEPLSMKLNFPYDTYNSKNFILDILRKYKYESNSNFLVNYFISIIENIMQFNYSSINKIGDRLNTFFPETVLVILGPLILPFMLIFIFIANNVYLIYLWFSQMGWFFKTNKNTSGTGKPQWADVSFFSPIRYYCAIVLVIFFSVLYFYLFPVVPIFASLAMNWGILSCITYKAKIGEETISVIQIIKDIFKSYKSIIMMIISFYVIFKSFINLGLMYGIFSTVILALIFFGISSIDSFNISNNVLSKIVGYKKGEKSCNFKGQNSNENQSILFNLYYAFLVVAVIVLISIFIVPLLIPSFILVLALILIIILIFILNNLLFGQKGGGNITTEIKEVGKKISRN